jgi:hypothetical protein
LDLYLYDVVSLIVHIWVSKVQITTYVVDQATSFFIFSRASSCGGLRWFCVYVNVYFSKVNCVGMEKVLPKIRVQFPHNLLEFVDIHDFWLL